jgi:cytochrome c oxidase subunit 3
MFFAAFFGALFYARVISVPWLGGAGNNMFTPELWEGFKATWPLINTPGAIGQNGTEFSVGFKLVDAWGLPALNTALLLTSGVTITFAHHALRKDHRNALIGWMIATIALGVLFLGFQAAEYGHAYHDGLKLTSGVYGSTFYLLTGFHGFHVTLGVIMLTVILYRIQKGHFDSENHFAFEGVAWYWHFVDVVWLGLFIFVYWL